MSKRQVLITGTTGFVGLHLAEFCVQQGAQVTGIGRSDQGPTDNGAGRASFELHQLDLASGSSELTGIIESLKPDRIFHLAAQASVAESWQSPWETLSQNLQTTQNLLDAVRLKSPDSRVLVSCSGEEYGPVDSDDLPVTESHPLRPQNPYALSKATVDLMCGFYADTYGLQVTRARAFNHFGPRQSATYVASSFARQIVQAELEGKTECTIKTGNTAVRRDFTDVRDVVRAYWLALDKGDPGIYNVCSGRSTPVTQLLEALAEHSELEVSSKVDPSLLRDHEVMEIRGSNQKLGTAVGWQPQIELQRTAADTLDWWRQHLQGGA